MSWYDDDFRFKPYVPVAQRRAQAAQQVAKLAKKGQVITPVRIEGRSIASTFWGQAWCRNLEGYSDYGNRLPRGRTYARNGSVVHLAIEPGQIEALVSGSSLYKIQITIAPVPKPAWTALKRACAGKMGSLVELLQGKLSQAVMERVTDRQGGLFPKPSEITMRCSCPDGAGMCKHIAAALYGVGHRLDAAPELLFKLRGVDHAELIDQAIPAVPTATRGRAPKLATADLGAIFDIEISEATVAPAKPKTRARTAAPAPPPQPTKAPVALAKPKPTTRAVAPKPGKAAVVQPASKPAAQTVAPQPAKTPVTPTKPKPAARAVAPKPAKATAARPTAQTAATQPSQKAVAPPQPKAQAGRPLPGKTKTKAR